MNGKKGKPHGPARSDCKFTLKIGNKHRELSFEETFAYGHSLVQSRDYPTATRIFKTLLKARATDPSTMIMLALCEAEDGNFEVCRQILLDLFEGKDAFVAERLHAALVYYTLGMFAEVVQEMTNLVNDRTDLPAVCLILGDVFGTKKQVDKAISCWKTAIKRDEKGGPVSITAKGELSRLKKAQSHQGH